MGTHSRPSSPALRSMANTGLPGNRFPGTLGCSCLTQTALLCLHRKEKGGLAGLGQRQVTKKRKGHENTLSRTRYKQSPMLNFNFYQALMPPFEGKGILPPNQRHVQAQNDGVSVTWRRVHAQSCRPRRLLDTAHSARPICTPLTHSHGPLCSSLMHTPHPQSHPTTPCPPHVLKSEHPPVLVMP